MNAPEPAWVGYILAAAATRPFREEPSTEEDGSSSAAKFAACVIDAIRECRRLGYRPTAFQSMIAEDGPLVAVRRLLQPPVARVSDGFTRLYEPRRIGLAVEHPVAFDRPFLSLFTDDERRIARERLALYGVTGPEE